LRRSVALEALEMTLALRRLHRDGRRRGAVLNAEFCVDLLKMLIDGSRTETQNLRDIPVGFAFAQPGQHFALAACQTEFPTEFRRGCPNLSPWRGAAEIHRSKFSHILQSKLLVLYWRGGRRSRLVETGLHLSEPIKPGGRQCERPGRRSRLMAHQQFLGLRRRPNDDALAIDHEQEAVGDVERGVDIFATTAARLQKSDRCRNATRRAIARYVPSRRRG
jgi:hypothetical protein